MFIAILLLTIALPLSLSHSFSIGTIRRWPPVLVKELGMFLNREIPEKIKGRPGMPQAPPPSPLKVAI